MSLHTNGTLLVAFDAVLYATPVAIQIPQKVKKRRGFFQFAHTTSYVYIISLMFSCRIHRNRM